MKTINTLALVAVLALTTLAAHAESIYDKGTAAYNEGNFAKALEIFDKQLKDHPDDAFSMAYVGACALAQHDTDRAIDMLNKAAGSLDAEDDLETLVWVHDLRSDAYQAAGDTLAAIDALSAAIVLKPKEVYYLNARGTLYQNLHMNREALTDFEHVLALDGKNVDAWVGKGYVFINQHERDLAVDAFETASKLDEANYEHWAKIAHDVKELQWEVQNTERDVTPEDEYEAPVFPGGKNSLTTFVDGEAAKRVPTVQGARVIVDCLINAKGRIDETKIVEGFNDEINAIAIDICKSLPVFRPAMLHHEPVDSWVQIPIHF